MKLLKILLYIVLAILIIGLILSFTGDKSYSVSRTQMINAPAEVIFPHVSDLRKMDAWSPWAASDPDQKVTYSGEDGKVGSSSAWDGKITGKGNQTIRSIEPNKSMISELKFIEPMNSTSEGFVELAPADGGTNVTWGFRGENNMMGRIMANFMDMDDMVGSEFEKGLTTLKSAAEAEAATVAAKGKKYDGFFIKNVERPAMSYVGKRKKIGFGEIQGFYAKTLPMAFGAVTGAGGKPSGAPSGIFFDWDEENKMTDLFAGAPVSAEDKAKVKGMESIDIPAGKALQIVYTGGYGGSGLAHYAMDNMMKAEGITMDQHVIEEYITDPMQEPDSNKWVTNIIYMVK